METIDRQLKALDVCELCQGDIQTDFGPFYVVASDKGIVSAGWNDSEARQDWVATRPVGAAAQRHLNQALSELKAYFEGKLTKFDVVLLTQGTEFQTDVWAGLRDIPYGVTWSYAKLAHHIGRPKAVRAVGQANRANRVAVIIPCHRVIGASGQMVGYAGNQTDLKEYLLHLEQSVAAF